MSSHYLAMEPTILTKAHAALPHAAMPHFSWSLEISKGPIVQKFPHWFLSTHVEIFDLFVSITFAIQIITVRKLHCHVRVTKTISHTKFEDFTTKYEFIITCPK